jgi:DNA-binding GntR family transcriptional regulator
VPSSPRSSNGKGPKRSADRRAKRSELHRGNRLVRTSSAEHIALHIRTLIFDGVLRPGMRIPQDAIAEDLGVSRIPVREALIVLENEGWVTIEMHRGAFINALDKRAVHDHYELYGLIYGFAAQRALARAGDELPKALAEIQRSFADATEPDDQQQLSIAFHGAIVRAAASPRINVALRAMSTLVPGDFFEMVPSAVDVERRGLAAIVRAMQKGDGERASAEYAKMMRQVGNKVTLLFDERSLFESTVTTP